MQIENGATPVALEIVGADEQTAADLRDIFDGENEDVTYSHAFGGVAIATVLTTLANLGTKLGTYWDKHKQSQAGGSLIVDGKKFTLQHFSREDIEKLLANPDFQKVTGAAGAA